MERKSSTKYDVIFVFETDFQKTIVDSILPKYNEANVLILDARGFKISFHGEVYRANINGIKNTICSIKDLFLFPKLRTKELICTAFTGINCRLFPAIIKHDKLTIIDDGSGTPAILKSGEYPWNRKYKNRFALSLIMVFLLRGKLLSRTKTLIKSAFKYYSIYSFVDKDFSEYTKHLNIIQLDYFSKYRFDKILYGTIGYVSNGVSDNKNELMGQIVEKTGHKPVYYPHPHEETANLNQANIKEIIRPNCILEQYFMNDGIPEMLFGDPSTVFINIILAGYPAKNVTVFYSDHQFNNAYYDIFRSLGMTIIRK